jgi:hypothetical protein
MRPIVDTTNLRRFSRHRLDHRQPYACLNHRRLECADRTIQIGFDTVLFHLCFEALNRLLGNIICKGVGMYVDDVQDQLRVGMICLAA